MNLCLTTCVQLLLFSFSRFVWLFDVKKKKKSKVSIQYEYRKYHIYNISPSQTPVVFVQIPVDHVEKQLAAFKCILTTL